MKWRVSEAAAQMQVLLKGNEEEADGLPQVRL